MDEIDIDWMSPPVRRAFLEGVSYFAEAVRDGTVMHMEDGLNAMHRAEQLHLTQETTGAPPNDPGI